MYSTRDRYRQHSPHHSHSPARHPIPSRPSAYSPRRPYSPPPFRPPIRDPRDRSPTSRSYPHYPERYPSRHGPYRETRPEYSSRGQIDEFNDRYRRAGTPEYPRSPTVVEFGQMADRYSLGRYASVGREERRHASDLPFTFAHRYSGGHSREGHPETGRREPLLPPARDILSVSPEMMGSRHNRREGDFIDRSHSAGERPFRPTYHHRTGEREYLERRGSPQRPEDILEAMRIPVQRRPNDVFLDSESTQRPKSTESSSTPAKSEPTPSRPVSYQPHHSPKLQGVASVQPRTGFPSSGLRSTAPPTPPNHRSSQNDSGTTFKL
jgi:hypothetical protein